MDALAQQYPSKVQVIVAGQSYEGRDIKGIKLSMQPDNNAVFIEGGKMKISTKFIFYASLLKSICYDIRMQYAPLSMNIK